MAQRGRFFDTVAYTETEYAEVMNRHREEGILRDVLSELTVTTPAGLFVRIAPGEALIQGFWYQNDANVDLAVGSNSSGVTRTDNVVLRLNRVTNSITLVVVPNAPTPTRTVGGDWELLLATVTIANGASTVTVTDARQGAFCGYTGKGIVSSGGGRSNVGMGPGNDKDTGANFISSNNWELVAGGVPIMALQPTVVALAMDASTATFQLGRAGLTAAVLGGMTVAQALAVTGAATFGSSLGVTGQFQPSSAGILAPVYIQAAANLLLQGIIPDGNLAQFQLTNAGSTKIANFILGTAAAQGLGGSGDLSVYTAGGSAGRLLLGTVGLLRGVIGTAGNWSLGAVEGAGKLNVFQSTNTAAGGVRVYHSGGVNTADYGIDAASRAIIGVAGVPYFHLHPTSGYVTFGTIAQDTHRLCVFQQSSAAAEGIRTVAGSAVGGLYSDAAGPWHLYSGGTDVVLLSAVAAMCPSGDQGAHLGQAGQRWATIYGMALVISGAGTFSSTISAAGASLTGALNMNTNAISGVTSITGGANWSINSVGTATFGTTALHGIVTGFANFSGTITVGGIGSDLVPAATSTFDLGSGSFRFRNVYANEGFKNTAGGWLAISSDERTKRDIRPYTDGLASILKITPRRFKYNGKHGSINDDKEYVGLIAQEARKAMPSLVVDSPLEIERGRDEHGRLIGKKEHVLTVDVSEIQYALVNAVKELVARIETLEAQLADRRN